ncbi:hypothetical protein CBF27_11540 [Vagococcus acidifermentans]|uniref:Uncharacterized protein n=1 Tax=Vagococcus acidifermentans TaxID=564710 RepID=A0A430APC7_9ENTE|nr:hypothetical protein CBF27_11540 [Vagococcus acidifermentans]
MSVKNTYRRQHSRFQPETGILPAEMNRANSLDWRFFARKKTLRSFNSEVSETSQNSGAFRMDNHSLSQTNEKSKHQENRCSFYRRTELFLLHVADF